MTTNLAELKQAAPAKKPATFPQMLAAWKGEIAHALPQHLNADRMARIALTEFRKNPKLGDCEPQSVFAAVLMASQLKSGSPTYGGMYELYVIAAVVVGIAWFLVVRIRALLADRRAGDPEPSAD